MKNKILMVLFGSLFVVAWVVYNLTHSLLVRLVSSGVFCCIAGLALGRMGAIPNETKRR